MAASALAFLLIGLVVDTKITDFRLFMRGPAEPIAPAASR
jgi:hypothetical protein